MLFLFVSDEILEYILNLIPRTLQRFTGVHARLREVVESHENQVSRDSGLRVFPKNTEAYRSTVPAGQVKRVHWGFCDEL